MAFPIIHMPIEPIGNFKHNSFAEFLTEKWSEYTKIPLFDVGRIDSPKDLPVKSVSKHTKESKRLITRQESWERYYKRNPYFRSYDDKMMLWMFKMIWTELIPGFLKGATQNQKDKIKFWMEVFTHFMEEVDYRGIDLRFFSAVMKEHGKEIEDEMKKRFPYLEAEKD